MTTRSVTMELNGVLSAVAASAQASGLFGPVRVQEGVLICPALASAAPAEYRVFTDAGRVWVALVTPDRYLSQSIEQDLVHTGDKLGDLLHDELIDVDHPAPYAPKVEHFRDGAKLFTFRSAVPPTDLEGDAAARVWLTLRAYSACFSPLGDMSAGDED